MEFDERIKTDLVSIGFQEKEGQPVMIENYDGKTYGVDFKKGEIFYLDGVERVSAEDDPADEYLQRLQTFIGKTMGYASKPAAEDEDDPAPDDSMRQQGKSEDEGIQEKLVEPDKSCATPLLDLIARYTGNDVIEVFGNTGSGKSKFAMTAAREAIAAGKKVFYLDTERNLTQADIRDLKGCEYKYTPGIEEIEKIVQDLPRITMHGLLFQNIRLMPVIRDRIKSVGRLVGSPDSNTHPFIRGNTHGIPCLVIRNLLRTIHRLEQFFKPDLLCNTGHYNHTVLRAETLKHLLNFAHNLFLFIPQTLPAKSMVSFRIR